jgi:hypothetical protein
MSAAFARELAIERAEATIAAALDDHGAATVAALRAGTRPPPWPRVVAAVDAAGLATDHDPGWAARAATLSRWALAARLDGDPGLAAARRGPATAAGLAARYRALGAAALRLGCGDVGALIGALFGARPRFGAAGPAESAAEVSAPPGVALPPWSTVAAALADHAGVDLGLVTVCDDGAAAATVVTTTAVVCVFPPVRDLGSLTVAAHELGHALYAAAMRGLPLGLAAPPSRAVDEAIAAWAVRALEELAPPWAAVAAARRRRAEAVRRALATVEAHGLGGGDVAAIWGELLGAWRPGLAAAVLAEPGVAAAYADADRVALTPAHGAIAAWGAAGAALDPRALGLAPAAGAA